MPNDGFVFRVPEGKIQGRFDPQTGRLHVDDVAVSEKGKGFGIRLYQILYNYASTRGEVKSISGFMALDNYKAFVRSGGDIDAMPHVHIVNRLGFTRHESKLVGAPGVKKTPFVESFRSKSAN